MYSHCRHDGWILGNTTDGTQAEYVRIPHADRSLHPFPPGGDEEVLVMLSDAFPTGFEIKECLGRRNRDPHSTDLWETHIVATLMLLLFGRSIVLVVR
jgi:threonine dehydrogenase-like Zn-dependent dehydrogenase